MATTVQQPTNVPMDGPPRQTHQGPPNTANLTNPSNAAPNMASAPKGKKVAKPGKKTPDANETGKLLAAKINQLELNAADEKGQELEVERQVRKVTRETNNHLASMGSPLEKLEYLQKKNQELLSELKKLERDHITLKKRTDQLQKERDASRTELSRTITLKDKMEKVAREFTMQNKKLRDEKRQIEESEKRNRDTMSDKNETLLVDIDRIMSRKLGDEADFVNRKVEEHFRQKFRTMFDQYNLREMHFLSIVRTKDAEIQHLITKLEYEKKVAENEIQRSRQLSAQNSTFSQTEAELRSQLNIYVEKFKQVEDTLNNSNDLFLTFRKEMEDMSKKTKRLEKENVNLTRKQELTNRNILEMAEERTKMEKESDNLRKKNTTLESIVRRMQDQGRGTGLSHGAGGLNEDDTQSEYGSGEEDEYDAASDEADYDDDTEEDLAMQNGIAPSASGASGHNGSIHSPSVPSPNDAVRKNVNLIC